MPSFNEVSQIMDQQVADGTTPAEEANRILCCYAKRLSSNKAFNKLKGSLSDFFHSGSLNGIDSTKVINDEYNLLKESMNSDENLCKVKVYSLDGSLLELSIPLFKLMQKVPLFINGEAQASTPQQSLLSEFTGKEAFVKKEELIKATTIGDLKKIIEIKVGTNPYLLRLFSESDDYLPSDDEPLEKSVDLDVLSKLEFTSLVVVNRFDLMQLPKPKLKRSRGQAFDALVFNANREADQGFYDAENDRESKRRML